MVIIPDAIYWKVLNLNRIRGKAILAQTSTLFFFAFLVAELLLTISFFPSINWKDNFIFHTKVTQLMKNEIKLTVEGSFTKKWIFFMYTNTLCKQQFI